MPSRHLFEYAVLQVVPRVDRDERINVGVMLWCAGADFLDTMCEVDAGKLRAIDPGADTGAIQGHLTALQAECRGDPGSGPIGALPNRERFLMLAAPRSTVIQPSPIHTGLCGDPAETLTALFGRLVATPELSHVRADD
tara:strand:+ start:541 stop:957 length:417 start_codon:yes stop_codon:yes gene_type:complete